MTSGEYFDVYSNTYYLRNRFYYQEQGRLYDADKYIPKAGDVFFRGAEHTGLVLAYSDGYVYTVERNVDNQVKVLQRPLSYFTHFGSNGGTSQGIVPSDYDNSYGRVV